MQFTDEQVKHIAKYARINLTDNEVTEFIPDLNSILNLIQELDNIDTTGIPQIDQITGLKDVMEKDEVKPFLDPESLIKCSPLPHKNNMIEVKKTINNH